jgi:hypothetical protein
MRANQNSLKGADAALAPSTSPPSLRDEWSLRKEKDLHTLLDPLHLHPSRRSPAQGCH